MIAWTVLLVLLVAVVVAAALAMRAGWRRRARSQAAVLPPFPQPPVPLTGAELLPVATGVYVGTAMAGDWQDRVAVGDVGFRSVAMLRLTGQGLLVERSGASSLWIPAGAVVGARTGRALAGTVLGTEGLLLVRWRLGDFELDTGFRGDDKDRDERWLAALRGLAAAGRGVDVKGDGR